MIQWANLDEVNEEVANLIQWANLDEVNGEVESLQVQRESVVPMQSNSLTTEIQPPLIKETLHKRAREEMSGVQDGDEQFFKKQKVLAEKCEIVVIDEEGEHNLLDKVVVIKEEKSTEWSNTSFS